MKHEFYAHGGAKKRRRIAVKRKVDYDSSLIRLEDRRRFVMFEFALVDERTESTVYTKAALERVAEESVGSTIKIYPQSDNRRVDGYVAEIFESKIVLCEDVSCGRTWKQIKSKAYIPSDTEFSDVIRKAARLAHGSLPPHSNIFVPWRDYVARGCDDD